MGPLNEFVQAKCFLPPVAGGQRWMKVGLEMGSRFRRTQILVAADPCRDFPKPEMLKGELGSASGTSP